MQSLIFKSRHIFLHVFLYLATTLLLVSFFRDNIVEEGLFRHAFADYQVWWAAGNAYTQHGPSAVYEIDTIRKYQGVFDSDFLRHKRPLEISVLPYAYPPFTLPLLSLIPTNDLLNSLLVSQGLLLLSSVISLVFVVWMMRWSGFSLSEGGALFIAIISSLFSYPMLFGFMMSNPSSLLVFPAACLLLAPQRPMLAGFLASGL